MSTYGNDPAPAPYGGMVAPEDHPRGVLILVLGVLSVVVLSFAVLLVGLFSLATSSGSSSSF